MNDSPPVPGNSWQALRQLTQARIALGRSGVSLPTAAQLDFQLAHARARDAVHAQLDAGALAQVFTASGQECLILHSAAPDRRSYLQRPDLGRRLDAPSRAALERFERCERHAPGAGCDLAVVIADGLSALAIERNAAPFLAALLARLAPDNCALAPIVIVQQGRVAIGDEVGQLLGARAVLVLIGERPGLSSPDSMGLYLTWDPHVGLTDAERNCISNVRAGGLSCDAAAAKLHYLWSQARQRGMSGVGLKDETAAPDSALHGPGRNFLLG